MRHIRASRFSIVRAYIRRGGLWPLMLRFCRCNVSCTVTNGRIRRLRLLNSASGKG